MCGACVSGEELHSWHEELASRREERAPRKYIFHSRREEHASRPPPGPQGRSPKYSYIAKIEVRPEAKPPPAGPCLKGGFDENQNSVPGLRLGAQRNGHRRRPRAGRCLPRLRLLPAEESLPGWLPVRRLLLRFGQLRVGLRLPDRLPAVRGNQRRIPFREREGGRGAGRGTDEHGQTRTDTDEGRPAQHASRGIRPCMSVFVRAAPPSPRPAPASQG